MSEFLDIIGLNLRNVFSKDLAFYMKSLFQELKKKQKSNILDNIQRIYD